MAPIFLRDFVLPRFAALGLVADADVISGIVSSLGYGVKNAVHANGGGGEQQWQVHAAAAQKAQEDLARLYSVLRQTRTKMDAEGVS